MDRRTKRLGPLAALLLGTALWARPAAADAPAVPLQRDVMMGQGRALFSEEYRVAFSSLNETLSLDLPPEADSSSLLVGDIRGAVQWIETRWTAVKTPPFDGVLELNQAGIPRSELSAPRRGALRAECALRAVSPRPRSVWALYEVTNLSWRARYDVTIRGDISNQLEPLSLDFEARYFLSNGLARALSARRVTLIGPERLKVGTSPGPTGPGILMLDASSPLADRWKPSTPPAEVPYRYEWPHPVTLSAGEVTAVRFASARRVPTDRLYVMDSDQIPIGAAPIRKPLTQVLAFRNIARIGLGIPLPAGVAWISTGSGRSALRQEALLHHTAPEESLRVVLGPESGVLGARRTLERGDEASGFSEETIELEIENNLASAVRVEVNERPPAPLAWDMVRSSHTYELQNRRLRFALDVNPRSRSIIRYTIRVAEGVN